MLPIHKYIKKPSLVLLSIIVKLGWLFPDKLYLQMMYRLKMGRSLNLKNPRRFTEKLQWTKLYYRLPILTTLVDKELVKPYVAKLIGEEHIIKNIGVWDSFDDIDFTILPDKFVLKTTNGGGGTNVVICRNKTQLDKPKTKRTIEKSQKQDIYKHLREWPYKNVSHRILCEEYKEDDSGELRDYKFFCFNGVPKVMLLASNRYTTHNFNYYDMDFNKLPITSVAGSQSSEELKRPDTFEEMKAIASKLSDGFPHVRVDLYSCEGKVYFGEMTFFDSSGYDNMSSDEWDLKFGSWMVLPDQKIM